METVRIDGLRELDRALGELPRQATAKAVLRRVLKRAGEPIAEKANALAPDDPSTPGGLHVSVVVGTKLNKRQARIERKADDRAFQAMYVGTNDVAGVQQEFGNINHGPQSFMRPAWDGEQHTALRIIADDLGDEIAKTAKRLAARGAR